MIALLALAFGGRAWAVECPVNAARLQELDGVVETAFSALDETTLQAGTRDLVHALDCLAEPVPAALAAQTHRALALADYVAGDRAEARESFAASRSLEPGYQIPSTLVPPKHPLRTLYTEAARPSGPGMDVEGTWLVDGIRMSSVPTDRPAIVQRLNDAGLVIFSTRTLSARAAGVELALVEVAIPPLDETRAEDGAALLARLTHLQTTQLDCPTITHALYDSGVVYTRLGDTAAAAAAFKGAQQRGEVCAADYASRASLALGENAGRRKGAAVKVKPRYDRFAVGVAVAAELGAHDQHRYTTVGVDEDYAPVGTSTWQYTQFGGALSATLDLRFAFSPWFELGLYGQLSQEKIVNDYQVTCTASGCPTYTDDSDATRMFEGSAFTTVVLASPRWHLKPLFRIGPVLRVVPKTDAIPQETIALSDGSGDVTVATPGFEPLPLGGVIFGPGLRVPVGRFMRLDFEQALVYFPKTYYGNIDANIDSDKEAVNPAKWAVRPTILLSVGF